MSTDIERQAIAAGWSRDGDGWWARPLREGDVPTASFNMRHKRFRAFLDDEDGVYCRTAAVALAFDRASKA